MRLAYHTPLANFLRRTLAAGCAALVFALGLCSASPVLHERLHDGGDMLTPDQCAVVLFANGVGMPLVVAALLPPPADWQERPSAVSIELLLDSPRYLLRPERGPPVA